VSLMSTLRLICGGRTAEPHPELPAGARASVHKAAVLFNQALQAPDQYRTFHQKIVGESFRQDVIGRCFEGMPVELVREPDNPHDPDAVRVTTVYGDIGYLPADSRFKDEFDPKRHVAARIASIRGGGNHNRGVWLEILARRGRL